MPSSQAIFQTATDPQQSWVAAIESLPRQTLSTDIPSPLFHLLQYFVSLSLPRTSAWTSKLLSSVVVRQHSSNPALFQIHLKEKLIAELPSRTQAIAIADRLEKMLLQPSFDANQLQPAIIKGKPAGKLGNEVLFVIDNDLARQLPRNGEWLAIDWVNRLRLTLGVDPLTLVEAQAKMYNLAETAEEIGGLASWYGPYFHGRLTATGETFDQNEFTAAHPDLPFNTFLKVTNLSNGKSVIVRVNDRGPYFEDRSLDLSREAARALSSEAAGVVNYKAVIMQPLGNAYNIALR
ncbi:MAG: septal ring lytic transglycosylase RlpA family protein [Leptolyngbyaceae bacterium]|nr:septal ring lytic transglycosylase RlpA family protein [Leptolyngbyaceae bacterium]